MTPRSQLLRNDGGKFSDVTAKVAAGLEKTGLVTSALWTDVDDDGWIDLLVTHEWGPVKLWRNRKGRLVDATTEARLAERTGWWNGIAGRDLDNDGKGRFEFRPLPHLAQAAPGFGVVLNDFDGDGWPDLVIGVNNDEVMTFLNGHPTENRVFNVRLKGKPGNPTGVGARVTLRAADGSIQTAEVHAGSGYLSQSTATLVFGLGNTRQPISLQVRWPNGEVTGHKIADSTKQAVVEQP